MFKIGSTVRRIALATLRPTQMTLGARMVDKKRGELAAMPLPERRDAMASALYPAVKGPDEAYYILDHHHGALAALREGADDVLVGTVVDLSALSFDDFWVFLDHRSWVHCYDDRGRRSTFDRIPDRFEDMADDPYRSLAASVQQAGGFAKPDEPFFEFLWANHLRTRIAAADVAERYDDAVDAAVAIARSDACAFLPGWVGR